MLKHGTEDILVLQNVRHFEHSYLLPELMPASCQEEEEKAQPKERDQIKGPPTLPPVKHT